LRVRVIALLTLWFCLGVGLAIGQGGTRGQTSGKVELTSIRITNRQLINVLVYGLVREITSDPPSPGQDLRIRLYRVPIEGNCMEDTHGTCSNRYYLAVHTFEEGLGEAVDDIGEVGEIADVQWLPSKKELVARLRLRVLSYPSFSDSPGITLQRGLRRIEQWYELEVSVTSLLLSRVSR